MSADTVPGGNVSDGEDRRIHELQEPAENPLQPGRRGRDAPAPQDVLQRELAYHEKLYSGFAQAHFARPAVRALRAHMAQRILRMTGAGASSRVLSLGCGIGDTELLLAPHVREIVGADLSPAAIRQARADAARMGIRNARFEVASAARLEKGDQARFEEGNQAGFEVDGEAPGRYDAVIAIFFLHHLPDVALAGLPEKIRECLEPGGVFYSLDPSRDRLSGVVGRKLIPGLMKKYQTPDERELEAAATAALFRRAGFDVRTEIYDFGSSPLAGLLPGWRFGYRAARGLDDVLLKSAALRRRGSNFELIACVKPAAPPH
jgi:SAM-dependent methyltransferase